MNEQQESQLEADGEQLEVCLEASEESVHAGGEPLVVMIEEGVVVAAAEHGEQDTSCEQAGVLVGTVATGQDRTVV